MISLKKYGIDFEGTIEDATQVIVPAMKMYPYKGEILWTQGMNRYFSEGVRAGGGGYGDLLLIKVYEKAGTTEQLRYLGELFEKRPRDQGPLLIEACLQILAYQELVKSGMGYVIAEIQDILRMPRYISFTMKQFDNVVDFHSALGLITNLSGPAFDIWFLQLFVQIVVILGLLGVAGINHRDMKGDNILISTINKQISKTVELAGRRCTFTFMNEIHIVDFGFSCKGDEGNIASVSAGPFFGLHDVCPKEGRDNYILLCYFYAQPAFRQNASARLLGFIRSYLTVPKVVEHLEKYGLTRTEYIYLLLNNKEFHSSHCNSVSLLRAISAHWPAIIEVI